MLQYADTLVYDTAHIVVWQQDPAYDYNREVIESDVSLMQWLFGLFTEFMRELINRALGEDFTLVLITLGVIALLGIGGFFLYRKRPQLFGRGTQEGIDYELEEDTIYGIDFDAEIAAALGRNDYREAVRLSYLKALRLLSETERIDWQLHKTPTQYITEYADADFQRLTVHFLRIRYGNFEATPDVYEEVNNLYQRLAQKNERKETRP